MPAANAVKISMSPTARYQLHQEALRQGRADSEIARRFVESGLAKAVNKAPPDPEVSVDKIERNARGTKVVAAYLSGPLASAIKKSVDRRKPLSKSCAARPVALSAAQTWSIKEPAMGFASRDRCPRSVIQ